MDEDLLELLNSGISIEDAISDLKTVLDDTIKNPNRIFKSWDDLDHAVDLLEVWQLEVEDTFGNLFSDTSYASELFIGSTSYYVHEHLERHGMREDIEFFRECYRARVEGLEKLINEFEGIKNSQSSIETVSKNIVQDVIVKNANKLESTGIKTVKVFIVHGHDLGLREAVARFVEKLGLETVILDEIAGSSRIIIEKFEQEAASAGFAIILMTPDDIAMPKTKLTSEQLRARQNVIFELGYFIGKLGRKKVRILRKGDAEILSDLYSVEYISAENSDTWKNKLAQEMRASGLPIDMNKI